MGAEEFGWTVMTILVLIPVFFGGAIIALCKFGLAVFAGVIAGYLGFKGYKCVDGKREEKVVNGTVVDNYPVKYEHKDNDKRR